MIKYFLTLPIGTVEVERGFSIMNLIKTDTRSRIHNDLLDALIMIVKNGP